MNIKKLAGWGMTLTLLGAWLYTKRAYSYERIHPQLRSPLVRLRTPPFTPTVVKVIRGLPANFPIPSDVRVESHRIAGPPGAPKVPVYVYRPYELQKPAAALLYIHGGGYIIGSASMFHDKCARYTRELGIVTVNVDYRLAPETPFPGPLEDCYAALKWIKEQADSLGIDPTRIAVTGDSAGGGLAAGLAQLAHDLGEVKPAFQLLVYPMLDDRTTLKLDHAGRGEFIWTPGSNLLGWSSYLDRKPLVEAAPAYAVPARRQDLSGLAPAWIGVGTLDLFYPENKEYAERLVEAGVPCEFYEVDGAYHASEFVHAKAPVSKAFLAHSLEAVRKGLGLAEGG